MWILVILAVLTFPIVAQEPTATPEPSTHIYMMIEAASTPYPASISLTATAGEIHIANLLTAILISIWAGILIFVWLVLAVRKWR